MNGIMENKRPLLSICIPTYNRASKLRKCISCVLEATRDKDNVEIIVSDNCSEDDTQKVLNEYSVVKNLRVYRNSRNLGFNGNVTLLIDRYATGHYCWIIGDDDYIDSDSLDLLLPYLVNQKYPFISIAHRCMAPEAFQIYQFSIRENVEFFVGPFFKCLDINSCSSNVLGTFMSSHIFKLDTVKAFDKTIFPVNTWNDYKSVFPNSYMMISCFHKSLECGCIRTPLITAMSYSKDWDDKLDKLVTEILPSYYEYCCCLCTELDWLKHNKRIVEDGKLNVELKNIKRSKSFLDKMKLLTPAFYHLYLKSIKLWVLARLDK